MNFDDLCPFDMGTPVKQEAVDGIHKGALRNFQICGKEVPRGYWVGTERSSLFKVVISIIV